MEINDKATIKDVYAIVNRIEDKMDREFVTKDEFNPVRNMVYGLVGLVLTAVVVAVLSQIIRQ